MATTHQHPGPRRLVAALPWTLAAAFTLALLATVVHAVLATGHLSLALGLAFASLAVLAMAADPRPSPAVIDQVDREVDAVIGLYVLAEDVVGKDPDGRILCHRRCCRLHRRLRRWPG